MKNILTILGARPQFIKSSILSQILNNDKNFDHRVLNTGQHYDLSMYDNILKSLNLKKPNYNLKIKNSENFLQNCLLKIEKTVLKKFRPKIIITYGDTQSTLLAGILAKKINCKLAHIESGLRSYNFKMPEELNRFVTDHLSNFLFTPNFKAKKILTKEGVKGKIYVVGDVMYDVFLASKRFVEQRKDKVLSKYSLQKKNYFFLTVHRKENTLNFKAYQNVFKFIKKLKLEKKIIFPAHPRLKNFHKKLKYPSNIKVIKPIDYIETQILLANALCCLTDSGGLQKEAYFNRVKCLTLRDETEWTETINNGWNVLWNKNRLIYKKQKNIDYGDGNASQKIYKILLKNL